MIRASGLTLRRGVKVLLQDAEFVVNPGERLGIVGKNGAGKSTLFSLLQGKLDLDAGTLYIPEGWQIASVEQEITDHDRPAREFVIDGDRRLRNLQAQRQDVSPGDGHRIAELENALVEADAWSAPSRAEQLLAGLGFAPDEWMRPVGEFSGGWQMRVALARALMAPSDLLLLDEPTNHLDLDAMLWLERWLSAYQGTVLLISHDTEFLDSVARSILHFDQGKLIRYKGGYEDFLLQRAERLRQTNLAWERQTRETARLQSFIDRFKAKATKAKQAQSRVKALARMEKLAPIHAEAGIDIRIPSPESMPDPLLTLRNVAAGYPPPSSCPQETAQNAPTDASISGDGSDAGIGKVVVKDVTLMVRAGSRIGVLGVNGAGKSTLIKTLAGELQALCGELKRSRGLSIGYFAQQQLDMLRLDETPLQHLARLAPQTREQELRNYLGGFGFSGDSVNSLVAPMSGGEKARLALSLIVWQKPNLLLLDEPSNHLDVDTREALATALAEFEGSVLLVSHDRHLLRTTVDTFWIVADGGVHEFDGDLEDYREWLNQRASAKRTESRANQATSDATGTAIDRKAQRRLEAEERQRLSKLRKPIEASISKIENEMSKIRARLDELDERIADPEFYTDAYRDERPALLAEHGEQGKRMHELEERWLELQEELESLS
ncbi:MAG TPA: ATP-binding cassette domain-containing protein [Pusillimonas sp.]|uniref:ribosomal protection-like ABC-F family protein n=1 Tax=Pusillimonas sp. TaxID=3040095 RepID=UPI002B4ACB82|nr:ATP-binding cassette domain-containing protein [Pusillimonas sp.]HLU20644.1 ATP-binding cassette domain-containing protein [Pusillimonas sp.]